jgi:hypothetical protein
VPFKADETVITLDSMLKSLPSESYQLIKDEHTTLLEFNGVQYPIPAPVERTIRAMSETFRGSELKEHLQADGRLTLIRHLTDTGFFNRRSRMTAGAIVRGARLAPRTV